MDTVYSHYAWLIPIFPLGAFLILAAAGRGMRTAGSVTAMAASLASLVLSVLVLLERLNGRAAEYNASFDWIATRGFQLSIGYDVTNLTALMLAMVSLISFLVSMYSAGYMKNDDRITVFYAYISLFTFSMLGLVLADNLLMLYMFWELVGVCSFLLIGFWYTKPAAKAAAKKAFLVTRVGDVGLLIAVLMLFWYMPEHELSFSAIQNVFNEGQSGLIAQGITTAIALLIFTGAIGKSGQFPLHVWLPDAMEGPTPISALIHAATMVAAGVFLIARTYSIFEASAAAMETVAFIGAFTALFAASIAMVQKDLKRILAYSTISQLGFMMLALGAGSLTGGIFHLLTHAFFKALLFLGAGSVIHAVHTQNIHEMGGLGQRMRITAWTFGIGALALAGVPPLSGFWSKDAILAAVLDEGHPLLFAAGLAASLLTALYMSRLFFLVFGGKSGAKTGAKTGSRKVLESPLVMTVPLVVLAVPAALLGLVELPWEGWGKLGSWLLGSTYSPQHDSSAVVMIMSTAVAALGLYIGWLVYGKGMISRTAAAARLPWLVNVLENKYYIDELYRYCIVRPVLGIGTLLVLFDRYIVGGAVRLAGGLAVLAGKAGTRMQNGQVQTYGLLTAAGLVILIVAVAGRRFW
ncbi:NADH-quinone oxidoreductase subunit L [Paenibacillus sambharensis]|uniref:NADH-quinone oxidoreductase subunit L n=1 Tax=Paenibacillus sambharensis TaxID=1803190 RepID=A0A2W1M1L0_9BACL|nr:NADH-quinone oxidoreductase subunit L [Paenibacillus sambharensis]PZD97801.1 NADH-quinone oxidoreductase subunit L [Paenibacillus sambharensis]